MAPTKPLVAQQVEACFNIVGMPQEDTSQMTGMLKRYYYAGIKRIYMNLV